MVRQFAFAAVLVAFSCSAISAADPNAAKYVIRGDASGEESDNLDKAIREYTVLLDKLVVSEHGLAILFAPTPTLYASQFLDQRTLQRR